MARAVECSVCGKLETEDQARNWRRLTVGVAAAGGFDTSVGVLSKPNADLCSARCALRWLTSIVARLFSR